MIVFNRWACTDSQSLVTAAYNMRHKYLLWFSLTLSGVICFPSDLTIYEFGTKEHAFGGLRWDNLFNHPRPYAEPVNETLASLFQYLTPSPIPNKPFSTSQYSICWNMNVRVFGFHQTVMMRLFHNENTEWSAPTGRVEKRHEHFFPAPPIGGGCTRESSANLQS